ncbi:MAG: antibiotic biosynthesis monooxygenase [Deltaproteobacteria bacterium]|nr:antibiotic biosynthesis monooxygenase [Deltaproteobacteria bacterium]
MPKPRSVHPATEEQPDVEIRIHATIRMILPARRRKEARDILASMIERINLEEGCISCRLYQDILDERALMLEEVWAGETSLHKHLRSADFRNVLLVVEMASEPPEIRFDRISSSTGISTIIEVRGEPDGFRSVSGPPPL